MKKNLVYALAGALFLSMGANAQQEGDTITNKEDSKYKFTVVKNLDATAVQDQSRTGTCWSFSTLSFIESELLRTGKGKHNLSEMFVARNVYLGKAINYVRMHGHHNFGAGGGFIDIPWVIKNYGMVPEEVYSGLQYGADKHNHAEMDAFLTKIVEETVKNPQKQLTPSWQKAFCGVLDAYLGEIPEKFSYKGKEYTPKSYAKSLGLNMDDYVSLTSYTHHPFYSKFVLEIPDNWDFAASYNLPIDEFMKVMEQSLMNGYTWAWGSDISEKGFSFRDGLAVVPEDESTIIKKGQDNKHFSDAGAEKIASCFNEPVEEKEITQEMRQLAFDNYETTDDHGMHITGIMKDQNGTKYFIVKNSWGGKYNECDGYFYASESFVKYKTMNILIHKDAIPKDLKKKLGII